MNFIMVNSVTLLQTLVLSKKDRDTAIERLFTRLNLGSTPNSPFSDDVALNLTRQLEARLMELDRDLDEKKVILCAVIVSLLQGLSFVWWTTHYLLSLMHFRN